MPDLGVVIPDPTTIIQRVGSIDHGGPLAWPDLHWIHGHGGNHRFDDPRGSHAQFTVLYGAEELEACFAETLDQFRLGHSWITRALSNIPPLPPDDPDNFDADHEQSPQGKGRVPASYLERRRIASFTIQSNLPFLNVQIDSTSVAEKLSLDPAMMSLLHQIGRPRIKPGDFVSNDRLLTQSIALWAFRHSYGGLVYTSSHNLHCKWRCWALFDGATIVECHPPREIEPDDPGLLNVLARFNLEIDTLDRRR